MKAICLLVFAFLSLTNSFYILPISQEDLDYIKNFQKAIPTDGVTFNEASALEDFFKGILQGTNAGFASDSIFCLKGNGPILLFEYYFGLAAAAGASGQNHALESTRNYLNSIGARLLKKMPLDFTECLAKSNDFRKIKDVLLVDPHSEEFLESFSEFSVGNLGIYYQTFGMIYQDFLKGNLFEAGRRFGRFITIAKDLEFSTRS